MKARRPFTEKSTHIFFERTHPYPKGGGCGVGLGRDTLNEATGTVNPSDYIYYMRAKTGWLMVIRIAFFLSMSSVFVRFSFFFLLSCFAVRDCTAVANAVFYLFTLSPVPTRFFFSRPLFSQCNFLFPFFFASPASCVYHQHICSSSGSLQNGIGCLILCSGTNKTMAQLHMEKQQQKNWNCSFTSLCSRSSELKSSGPRIAAFRAFPS